MTREGDNTAQALKVLKARYLLFCTMLHALSLLTFYNFASGCIFLLLRQLRLASIDFVGFSLVGIPICLLVALALAFRRQLDDSRGMALLDGYNQSGGLLLAQFETGDQSWKNRHGELKTPAFRVNLSGRLPALLVSIMFVVLSITMPVRQVQGDRDPRLELKDVQQTATAQVEALEEAGLIDEQKADELKETIEQISAASDRNDPSKTFEAFDQLQEKMRKESSVGAQKMQTEQENLQSLQTLADQLENANSPEKMSQALDALREKLEKCGMDAASIKQPGEKSLEQNMQQAGQGGQQSAESSAAAAQQLKDYIQQRSEELRAAAEKLVKARLLDRKTYEKLKEEGRLRPATEADLAPGSGADLVIAPAEAGESQEESGQQPGGSDSGQPGSRGGQPGSEGGQPGSEGGQPGIMVVDPTQGGASGQAGRDGGSAPLNFSRQSSEHQLKFKDEALPAPAAQAIEDSVAIGMAVSAPQVGSTSGDTPSGRVDWQKSEKSGGESDIILPRHRSAVRRYFERNVPKQRRQQ